MKNSKKVNKTIPKKIIKIPTTTEMEWHRTFNQESMQWNSRFTIMNISWLSATIIMSGVIIWMLSGL